MATITTNFGTVTVLSPSTLVISLSEVEAAAIVAEAVTAFTPTGNQAAFPNIFKLMLGLQTANGLTAAVGSNGTAPPQTTTVTLPA